MACETVATTRCGLDDALLEAGEMLADLGLLEVGVRVIEFGDEGLALGVPDDVNENVSVRPRDAQLEVNVGVPRETLSCFDCSTVRTCSTGFIQTVSVSARATVRRLSYPSTS